MRSRVALSTPIALSRPLRLGGCAALVLVALWLGACGSRSPAAAAAPVDAAAPANDTGVDAEAADAPAADVAAGADTLDATSIACLAGCRVDPVEDCAGCWQNLGQCCHGDPSYFGKVKDLTQVCEGRERCRACCNECASLTCAAIKEGLLCPLSF